MILIKYVFVLHFRILHYSRMLFEHNAVETGE
jgi:hypothetical protein